uniref:pre-toxin TG domain-containing protein n=1 Tax=Geobacillus icigianus TaxID=1430331 RepID=UPI002D773E8A|nr:pre-toxin TG domain-containing protein [Geobacillus icigianus]
MQRVFGEYDPITGERLSIRGRLLAGGMLLASMVPPAKGAGMAGKAAIKGAKAIDAASALAKVKHVVRDDTMKTIFHTIYYQVIKAPFAETARLFKTQWDELVKSVASVSWQPAYAGVGSAPWGWMREAKDATLNRIKNVEGEAVEKGISEAEKLAKGTKKTRPSWRQSEIDVGKEYPGYREQVSFKDGNEVSHGTKNSSRPDFYINGHGVEVKNYKVTTFSGRSNLIRSVSKQINKRISDLPEQTRQTVIIDVRGQNVTREVLRDIKQKINEKTDGVAEIIFKMD